MYYPGNVAKQDVALHKYIRDDLRRICFQQWKKLDFFIREIELGCQADLVKQLLAQQKLSWSKRKIAALGNDLYEYRGTQSPKGTVRMYFAYANETLMILDAECKTSDANVSDRARKRLMDMAQSTIK